MRKFALVLSALAAVLFVSGTAHAQSFSSSSSSVSVRGGSVGVGFSAYSSHYSNRNGNRGTSVDIHIGTRNGHIGIHTGRGGGWQRGPVYRYPQYPVYRQPAPVYRQPAPVYRDPCGVNYGCGSPVASTITVRVQETYVDRYGRLCYTGRTLLYTAWYDARYGGYVYQNQYGELVRVR